MIYNNIYSKMGTTGSKGDTGDKGERGPTGPSGINGLPGIAGKDGRDGVLSLSSITEEQKILLMNILANDSQKRFVGPTGPKGDTGLRGEQGPIGPAVNLNDYAKLDNLKNLNPSSFSVNGIKTYPDGGGVQRTPNLSIFSNQQTNRDFVIANVTSGINGGDIAFNPRWGGNVKIGYDPYGLDENPSKDTNVPSSRLAVKGDINASENLIGKSINVGNWNIFEDSNKCLNYNIKNTSSSYKICPYNVNKPLDINNSNLYSFELGGTTDGLGSWTSGQPLNEGFGNVNNFAVKPSTRGPSNWKWGHININISKLFTQDNINKWSYLDIYFMVLAPDSHRPNTNSPVFKITNTNSATTDSNQDGGTGKIYSGMVLYNKIQNWINIKNNGIIMDNLNNIYTDKPTYRVRIPFSYLKDTENNFIRFTGIHYADGAVHMSICDIVLF